MKVFIRSVPEKWVRCFQVGDWFYDELGIESRVSEEIQPEESQLAIGIHEAIEAFLCRKAGITDAAVVDFDTMYEKERSEGNHSDTDEPGDDPRSPYREQHMAATHVEKAVCLALGITWREHEQSLLGSEADHPKNESHVSHRP